MSRPQRLDLMERGHPRLTVVRQCELLGLNRSSVYYEPVRASEEDLELMGLIDRQFLLTPFFGVRRMLEALRRQGRPVGRKHVRRLMQTMGLSAIYPRPRTLGRSRSHPMYPYLLRGLTVTRSNHVWATDITYIPMVRGFLYLVAILDWASRYELSWRLSNTLDAEFCVEALQQALARGRPEILNSDQGSQLQTLRVHERRVHGSPVERRGPDQHGREGALPGQRVGFADASRSRSVCGGA